MNSFTEIPIGSDDSRVCTNNKQETYGFNNLLHFHGSGAFDLEHFPEWNSLLLNMTGLPSDVIVVRTKSRGKGWSKNNPYVEEVSSHCLVLLW